MQHLSPRGLDPNLDFARVLLYDSRLFIPLLPYLSLLLLMLLLLLLLLLLLPFWLSSTPSPAVSQYLIATKLQLLFALP